MPLQDFVSVGLLLRFTLQSKVHCFNDAWYLTAEFAGLALTERLLTHDVQGMAPSVPESRTRFNTVQKISLAFSIKQKGTCAFYVRLWHSSIGADASHIAFWCGLTHYDEWQCDKTYTTQ